MIRLAVPSIEEDDVEAVREVLMSGHLVQGRRVAEFERLVGDRARSAHAVAVANCTAALHLALLGLGIKSGDRVAVPAFSWPATANVVELCGAEPVFVDIDRATFNIDPSALERVLERTAVKLVMVVHAFGNMANMPRISEMAAQHGVPVLEDAACALGATLGGKPAGAWGVAGCFSFHPRKPITTGEGGMLVTNDASLARTVRVLRNHGLDPESDRQEFVAPGFNLRLTDIQAALGTTQMAKLDRLVDFRRRAAERYDVMLRDTGITVQLPLAEDAHVHQAYVVAVPGGTALRDGVLARLRKSSIEVAIGTHHLPLTGYFKRRYGYDLGDFPATDDIALRTLALPLHEKLTQEDQETVVGALIEAIGSPVCG